MSFDLPDKKPSRHYRLEQPVYEIWRQFDQRGAHESLQDWLTASLRAAIVAGKLGPGARLPASRQLAAALQLSRNTVAIVYERLLAEGLLDARVGTGTFVSKRLERVRPKTQTPSRPRRLAARVSPLMPVPGERPGSDANRPLTPGLPDTDLFPHALWARLASRYWKRRPTLGYEDAAGLPALRAAICGFIGATRGVACHPEQIFITAGTQGALSAVFHVLLNPGDTAWVEDPGYRQVWRGLRLVDAEPVAVAVDEQGLSVTDGMTVAPDARLAIVSPSHQYPSGAQMSLARRLELLNWATQSDAWIVEDDYDGEYRYEGAPIQSLKSLDRDDRVLYVGTLSKLLAPGLRLGFMVVPDALIEPLKAIRMAVDYGIATPVQAVFADFVGQGHLGAHIRKTRSIYNARRLQVLAATAAMPGLNAVLGSDAGLHLLAQISHGSDRQVARACYDRGLGVAALSSYRFQPGSGQASKTGKPALVIGYANASGQRLTEALAVLHETLAHLS